MGLYIGLLHVKQNISPLRHLSGPFLFILTEFLVPDLEIMQDLSKEGRRI